MDKQIIFDETVSYLLAKVATAYRTALERHMGAIDLHGGQTFVLIELWNEDGLRQIDIARRLSVSAPTINKMLKGLVEINLVENRQISGDARATRIFLTKRGRDIRTDVERRWIDLEAECLTGLTETERLVLLDVLRKLRITYTGRSDSEE